MRILICGDRNYRDARQIYKWMEPLPKDTVIIQGEAKGADTIVWICAELLGLKYESYPADWTTHHLAAGPIRNKQMLEEGKPDFVVWFHKDLPSSKGTANMIKQAGAAGINVSSGEINLS